MTGPSASARPRTRLRAASRSRSPSPTAAAARRSAGILASSQVVFCAGRAGVRILDRQQLEAASGLMVAADVNAVPPSGVEGLKVDAKGETIGESKVLGVGALTIGQLKSKTEWGCSGR